jgi:hypothetical protein
MSGAGDVAQGPDAHPDTSAEIGFGTHPLTIEETVWLMRHHDAPTLIERTEASVRLLCLRALPGQAEWVLHAPASTAITLWERMVAACPADADPLAAGMAAFRRAWAADGPGETAS